MSPDLRRTLCRDLLLFAIALALSGILKLTLLCLGLDWPILGLNGFNAIMGLHQFVKWLAEKITGKV